MNSELPLAMVLWRCQCSHHSPVQWPLLVPLACAYTGAAGIPGEPQILSSAPVSAPAGPAKNRCLLEVQPLHQSPSVFKECHMDWKIRL